MPHERIYSLDGDPDHNNCAQVAWGHPSSPSNTGPGHGNDEGHVMIAVERPGGPARTAHPSLGDVRENLLKTIWLIRNQAEQGKLDLTDDESIADFMMKHFSDDLSYAWGGQLDLLAVTIDRKGCNKMISALRRGRDAAFGRDE